MQRIYRKGFIFLRAICVSAFANPMVVWAMSPPPPNECNFRGATFIGVSEQPKSGTLVRLEWNPQGSGYLAFADSAGRRTVHTISGSLCGNGGIEFLFRHDSGDDPPVVRAESRGDSFTLIFVFPRAEAELLREAKFVPRDENIRRLGEVARLQIEQKRRSEARKPER